MVPESVDDVDDDAKDRFLAPVGMCAALASTVDPAARGDGALGGLFTMGPVTLGTAILGPVTLGRLVLGPVTVGTMTPGTILCKVATALAAEPTPLTRVAPALAPYNVPVV
jgi:hypothetical protein